MKKTTLKLTGLLFLFIAILGLAACGSSTETVTLEGEMVGMNTVVTLEAEDDEVIKQSVSMEVPYSMLQVESAEQAEENLDEMIRSELEAFADIEGVEADVSYEDDHVAQIIDVDFEAVDMDAIGEIPSVDPSMLEDDQDMSLENFVSDLESAGLEVVEE